MRPLLAMLATSLAFATPALAMEKTAHSAAVQAAAPKLGGVTFTTVDGYQMTAVLIVGGGVLPQRLILTRPPNEWELSHLGNSSETQKSVPEADYDMRFRALSEEHGTAALQVFAKVCELKQVEGREMARLHATISVPDCRSVEQTLSIPDGDTVPLIVKETGERLGTLTWNTMPFTSPRPN